MGDYEKRAAKLLAKADVRINGKRSWDLITKNPEILFRKVFAGGELAVCEAWMNREWDCADLFEFLARIFSSGIEREVRTFSDLLLMLKAKLIDAQSKERSTQVAKDHYDLGNPIYELWLDPTMTYSSAIWAGVDGLADAQLQKIRHICKKLRFEPGMSFLDIGCGWGGLAYVAASEYKVNVVGLTLSGEQAAKAKERCKGLPVEIRVEDYRDHRSKRKYQRIGSVGMIEHVGSDHYPEYFKRAYDLLEDRGYFMCHGIVSPKPRAKNPFIDKYIFPGGEIGTVWQIPQAAEGAGFVTEDWENFGNGYHLTLKAWCRNFNERWPEIQKLARSNPNVQRVFGTVDRFQRGQIMYLVGSAAKFYLRHLSVGQYIFSKNLTGERYPAIRL